MRPGHLALFHFEIGNRGVELRIPVDQALVAVNQALAVQLHEHFADGEREPFVHGETLARPIGRSAEPAQLAGDRARRIRLSIPRPAR